MCWYPWSSQPRWLRCAPHLRLVPGAGCGCRPNRLQRIPAGITSGERLWSRGRHCGIYFGCDDFSHADRSGVSTQELRQGRWESQWAIGVAAPPLWPELAGKTLGILGFGHIGQAVARRAVAFDMRVCAVRRAAQTEGPSGVSFVGGLERLEEVLRLSDYLAVTLSLSSATRNLIERTSPAPDETCGVPDQRCPRGDFR